MFPRRKFVLVSLYWFVRGLSLIHIFTNQAHKLMHVSNLFTTEPMIQVAKKLVEKTHLNGKVFFANSGAEAKDVYKRQT